MTFLPSAISIMSRPRSSTARPVGSTPWNGAPVKWAVMRHSTATWVWSAATRITVVSASGKAANISLKNAAISSWPRRIPSGTRSMTPSSFQCATTPSTSRPAMASK